MIFLRISVISILLSTCYYVTAEPNLWIIDTDAGADDGVAISFFLGIEKLQKTVKLQALSAVAGNTNADNVAINLLKILKTANRLDIPVYKGANQSILISPPGDNFFGDDGFGDFPFPDPPSEDLIQSTHSVNYFIDAVKSNPGKVNILAIGPLTNLGMAIRMDPNFLKNTGRIVILGGSVKGVGNVKPGIEFNFYVDPEAVYIVFDEAKRIGKVLELLSWEASVDVGITSDWRRNVLGALTSPIINLLNNAEASQLNETLWISADTFATMYAIDSNFPSKTDVFTGYMEVCGTYGRGISMVDYNHSGEQEQLRIITPGSLNTTYITDKLIEVFTEFTPARGRLQN